MKPYLQPYLLITSLLLILLSGCSDDSLFDENDHSSGRPLKPGESCTISFINSVGSISEATTRSLPEGKKSVLHDFTNQRLKGKDGSRAGWMSGEVRTRYDEDVIRATARSFDATTQLFGANSEFRMLVFAGPYGGSVDMSSPIASLKCQVNSDGKGASFIPPTTSLCLLKGRYTFICFPADEKYNTWEVGQTNGYEIPITKDEDFVCMQLPNVNISNTEYKVDLSKFVRYGYQLTVKFQVNEALGYLLFPQDELVLDISDDGSSTNGRVINTDATFDLKANSIKDYSNSTSHFSNTLKIDKAEMGQTFTPVSNFLIANNSASQKLTITYPELTFLKPAASGSNEEDSVFTIKPGTYVTNEEVQFESGKSYTITLTVGEQVKGLIVGGVIWSPGNLDYDKDKNEFFWAPTPDEARTARQARGSYFRWMAPLAQNVESAYTAINIPWSSIITPQWNEDNSGDLSNYKNYYKTILAKVPELVLGTFSDDPLVVESLGDPCWGMGNGWRMPTYNEIYLLCYVSPNATPKGTFTTPRYKYQNINSYSDIMNGAVTSEAARYAGIFISCSKKPNENPVAITTKSQYNGSQLFLPAAGYASSSYASSFGTLGRYWSSTPCNDSSNAWSLTFSNTNLNPYSNPRNQAFSIRCVLGD